MTDTGKSVQGCFNFLEAVFRDTCKMIGVFEEIAEGRYHLKPEIKEKRVAFRCSTSYKVHEKWLYSYLCRTYVPEDPASSDRLRLFLFVYFTPLNLEYPLVVFGAARLTRIVTGFSNWAEKPFMQRQPACFIKESQGKWMSDLPRMDTVEELHCKFLPLTEIDSQEKVEKICQDAVSKLEELSAK